MEPTPPAPAVRLPIYALYPVQVALVVPHTTTMVWHCVLRAWCPALPATQAPNASHAFLATQPPKPAEDACAMPATTAVQRLLALSVTTVAQPVHQIPIQLARPARLPHLDPWLGRPAHAIQDISTME